MARHDGSDFWRNLDVLLVAWQVVIDRPKGSAHPMYVKAIYPVDHGCPTGTQVADADGVDVWRRTAEAGAFDTVVFTVDQVKKDVEVKILLGCMAQEKRQIMDFHTGGMLVERPV